MSIETQAAALENALTGTSTSNFAAIFSGFAAKGIPNEDIRPRENVFTFDAWLALGRHVRKGEHGVRITTRVEIEKRKEDGTVEKITTPRHTTVFHITQTDEGGRDRPAKPRGNWKRRRQ